MVEGFYDRTRELAILTEKDRSPHAEFGVLYGRRRVGKTRLTEQFLTQTTRRSLFITSTEISGRSFMNKLASEVERQLKDTITITEWTDFFDYLTRTAKKHPITVIIDEFQRIHEHTQDFIYHLQDAWDKQLRHERILLIVSGSSMSMMQKIVLEQSGALYGRTTFRLPIRPFSYLDFRAMFPELSEAERVTLYSIFGGTPKYLQDYRRTGTGPLEAIERLILSEHGPLYNEPLLALDLELKNSERYIAILDAISRGKRELKEIADDLNTPSSSITQYLTNLEKLLDITTSYDPLLGKKRQKRHAINDPFYAFWFRFVYLRREELALRSTEHILTRIEEDLPTHSGAVFEQIVRELLISFNGSTIHEKPIEFHRAGPWWNREDEIDLVLLGEEHTYFVEAKFRNERVGISVLNELMRKSKLTRFSGTAHYLIVSKSGFTEELKESENVTLIELEELGELIGTRSA
ncbi:MAG: ATP-binding protein [Candidatus Woesearchaeota archaeon]